MMKKINPRAMDIVITTILTLAIVFFVNACVNVFPKELDFSEGNYYSIGDTTKEILGSLDRRVEIYAFFDEEKADADYRKIEALLRNYEAASKGMLTVSYVDPDRNPNLYNEYDPEGVLELSKDSFLVTDGDKARKIAYEDLFEMQYDERTSAWFHTGSNAEQAFTDAVNYVGKDEKKVIYYVENGDGSYADYQLFWDEMNRMGYKCDCVNLDDEVPGNAALLVFLNMQCDLTDGQEEHVRTFLADGGRAMFFAGKEQAGYDRLSGILSDYGILVNGDRLYDPAKSGDMEADRAGSDALPADVSETGDIETDRAGSDALPADRLESGDIETDSRLLVSAMSSAVIPLDTYGILLTDPSSLTLFEENGVHPYPIIQTDDKVRSDLQTGSRTYSVAAVSEKNDSRVAVFSGSDFINDQMSEEAGGYFSMGLYAAESTAEWLASTELVIETKEYNAGEIEISNDKIGYIGIVTIGIIPLYIFGAGFVIWRRRRYL